MVVEQFLQTYASSLMQGSWLVLGIAFMAGILSSAICPFTLPVGLGVAGVVGTAESRVRGSGFPIATALFAGLVLSLTARRGRGRLRSRRHPGRWPMVDADHGGAGIRRRSGGAVRAFT